MTIIKRGLICVVIAAHLCACAPVVPVVPVVSEAQRGRMGTVGVVALASAPQGDLAVRTRGHGAGAAQGALDGAEVGAALGFVACAVAIISLSPSSYCAFPEPVLVGAILGAVVGQAAPEDKRGKIEARAVVDYVQLLDATPEDKRGETEARLRAIFEAEAELQGKLRFAVVDTAARAGVQGVTEITAGTPTVVGQDVDHRQLPEAKVDTILEVGLVSVRFISRGGADPELALHVGAVARLMDARTKAELFRGDAFTYEAKPRKFSEWNADESRLIKEEIESAYRSLGQSIVDEIFLVVRTN